jgi:uroporphyrinogen-III synthase
VSRPILIVRPKPGADRTSERARKLGLTTIVAPLFTIRALPWKAPDRPFDALLLTSANAPRQAGSGLTSFAGVACFAVGETTAAAAREAGLTNIHTGESDGGAVLEMMAARGIGSALHLCGREHRLPSDSQIEIVSVPVYAAEAVSTLPDKAAAAIDKGAVTLLHSPRAAALYAWLVGERRSRIAIAAISAATAGAAGAGWAAIEVAAEPRDQALLEAAAKLCH